MEIPETPAYLQALNGEQLEAALHRGPPLLILAGAGSGKTRVITSKIGYLIREAGLPPWSILAVTFTNKAAREMAERAQAIDERSGGAMIRTFHSFGAWFLRRYAAQAGLDGRFTIYDDDDSQNIIARIMGKKAQKSEHRRMTRNIALAKDYFYAPEDAELALIDHNDGFPEIYARYERDLSQTGNVDFGDLIKKPVEIMRRDADVAREIRRRFRVILVDEYQDANIAQSALLRELYDGENYLCVVGDDDQSIYGFRGAEVRNILSFREQFEGAALIRLERNYRSTQEILNLAGAVIAHNRRRLGKTLAAERGGGKKPRLLYTPNQDTEAADCARLILQSRTTGAAFADWAVLYRTNAQSLGFESEFLRRGIPYRVIGSLKFYEREEVKDALSLLAFLLNPRNTVAFRRMVNKPARGVGEAALETVMDAAEEHGWDIEKAAQAQAARLSARARAGVEIFLSALSAARGLLDGEDAPEEPGGAAPPDGADGPPGGGIRGTRGLSRCAACLINRTGLAAHYFSRDEYKAEQRINNLQELTNNAVLYPASRDGLAAFLEQIELDKSLESAEDEARKDRVNLITLHNTKGLEFRRVIISACEQGLFPRLGKAGDELEEERRLFYVGATRAMDELYFTCAAERRIFGETKTQKRSVFLDEALKEDEGALLDIEGVPGIPGGFASPRRFASGYAVTNRADRLAQSRCGRWTAGDRVFHDDEGYGEVAGFEDEDGEEVVRVRFETGRSRRFLNGSQTGALMKIKE